MDWFDANATQEGLLPNERRVAGPGGQLTPNGSNVPGQYWPSLGQTSAAANNPYQMGTFTGGGKYPLASVMGPGLMQPWTTPFNAPTVTDDPGYKFRFDEGLQALQRSAAAKGTLLGGGTLKDTMAFAQGLASQEYGNAYNRALGEYTMAHDIYSGNQQNQFNRLYGISGMGQNAAANQGNAGAGYAQSASDLITGMGNAAAAGQVGSGNAWSQFAGGLGNNLTNLYLYNQLYGSQPNTGTGYTGSTYTPTGAPMAGAPPYTQPPPTIGVPGVYQW